MLIQRNSIVLVILLLSLCFFSYSKKANDDEKIEDLEREFYKLDVQTAQWLKLMNENPRLIIPGTFFQDLEKRNELAAKLAIKKAEIAKKVAEEEKEKEGLREVINSLRESEA